MFSYKDFGMEILAYQSTTHNYVEIILNFGLIGSAFIAFFCGIILNILKQNKSMNCIYIPLCCNLPFFFFRSFNDAVVKHIIAYSILLPFILFLTTHLKNKFKKDGHISYSSLFQ